MSGTDGDDSREIYRFPDFFDRLEAAGALDVRDAVHSETEIDGLVYHHRGVQAPAYMAMFTWEPESEANNHGSEPTFSLETGTVGPRKAWARFDATKSWDIYLVLFTGGAVVAWMSDAEFEAEEADSFPSKAAAIRAGRFSFGTFFRFGPDWVEREEWALESSAPAILQLGDGRVIMPESEREFTDYTEAIPVELRPGETRAPPDYLGLLDVEITNN